MHCYIYKFFKFKFFILTKHYKWKVLKIDSKIIQDNQPKDTYFMYLLLGIQFT